MVKYEYVYEKMDLDYYYMHNPHGGLRVLLALKNGAYYNQKQFQKKLNKYK